MSYLEYPNQTIEKIKTAFKKTQGELSAAFDADGTLWDTDIGEYFFNYQIKNNLLSGLPKNPFQEYENKKKHNKAHGLAWLAQVNANQPLEKVQLWAKESAQEYKNFPIFPAQKKLISWMQQEKILVYIVTASCKWAVEPFAALLNIPPQNVIGVETQVQNGIVSDLVISPVTCSEGKTERFKQITGKTPTAAFGNTMSDFYLLKSAELAVAVSSTPKDHALFFTEQELRKEAEQREWLTHRF